jgi:hypothetical protein
MNSRLNRYCVLCLANVFKPKYSVNISALNGKGRNPSLGSWSSMDCHPGGNISHKPTFSCNQMILYSMFSLNSHGMSKVFSERKAPNNLQKKLSSSSVKWMQVVQTLSFSGSVLSTACSVMV